MNMLDLLQEDVQKASNPKKAAFVSGYFKTKEGEYGYGDVFLGLTVPQCRIIAKRYNNLPFGNLKTLLHSKYHEERLIALLILVEQFFHVDQKAKNKIYTFYLSHTKYINNWDLVDLSADKIVGQYLIENSENKNILQRLAKSEMVWERRIAMIACYQFIKNGKSSEALEIADILLYDKHDLIQKAVGWMLREIGKRCGEDSEETFLKTRYKTMPRTTLRYAIEKFTEEKRKNYLQGHI
jgi:3-methyladenine DNA glycosylase AlkD